jgi:predicted RNase H-like HicB family nuclease
MRSFLIVIEKAEQNWSAFSPDLPGCIATGQTPEETRQNMQAAIEMHVQGMLEDGLAIPEPQALAETVTLPD